MNTTYCLTINNPLNNINEWCTQWNATGNFVEKFVQHDISGQSFTNTVQQVRHGETQHTHDQQDTHTHAQQPVGIL